jgi:hypothetical protein
MTWGHAWGRRAQVGGGQGDGDGAGGADGHLENETVASNT